MIPPWSLVKSVRVPWSSASDATSPTTRLSMNLTWSRPVTCVCSMWDTSNNDTCSLQTTNTGRLSCHSPVGGPPADHQADHEVEPVRACDQCPQHVGYVKIRAPTANQPSHQPTRPTQLSLSRGWSPQPTNRLSTNSSRSRPVTSMWDTSNSDTSPAPHHILPTSAKVSK